MRVRYAGLLLAAVAVLACINEAKSTVLSGSLHVDNRNGHVQRILRSAGNGNEDRSFISLKTLSDHIALASKHLEAENEQSLMDVVRSALRNIEPSLRLDSEGVVRNYIETARSDTSTAEHLSNSDGAIEMVPTIVALRDAENHEGVQNIADSLQQLQLELWEHESVSAAEVFKLLELSGLVNQAKNAPYAKETASLVKDRKLAIWIAYARHISNDDREATINSMTHVLTSQFDKDWNAAKSFATGVYNEDEMSKKQHDLQHNGQLRIEGAKEKEGGPNHVEGTKSGGNKRGQEEVSDLEPDAQKQKQVKYSQLPTLKRSIEGMSNLNLLG